MAALSKTNVYTLFSKVNAAFTVPCTAFYSLKQDKLYDTEGTAPVVSHRAAIPFGGKKESRICMKTTQMRDSEMVGEGGFEPPKLKNNRFTVCPLWPLGNSPL